MRRWIEGLETFAVDVILGRRYGRRADILRWVLRGLSWIYLPIVAARLALYRQRVMRSRAPGCPVISIGNLTVGGTGKTPLVEMLARTLSARGRRVAILSRGYKSAPRPLALRLWDRFLGKNAVFLPRVVSDGSSLLLDSRVAGDEPFMLASNLKGVVVLVDRDRVKAALHAVQKFGADTILLDDGYQYLRMRRAYEIALVDRTAPFGNGFLLPRGTLREPPKNLERATHVFITKSNGSDNADLIRQIRRHNRVADIIECAHRPLHLRNFSTGEIIPLDFLRGRKVGALCAIATPSSFEAGLRALGAEVALSKSYTDHHRYTTREVENFILRCGKRDLDAVMTTEKDAVRFPLLQNPEVPVYYLRMEIEILRGHQFYDDLIARLTRPQALVAPEPLYA